MNFSVKIFFLILLFIGNTHIVFAQENTPETSPGFISDDLFIYMHSGPGTNYRILGSINAGTQVQIHQELENNYQKITDARGREGWVESKYVSTNPSLKSVVAELNGKLASATEQLTQQDSELGDKRQSIQTLETESAQLKKQISELSQQLSETKKQLSTQDMEVKKEWFFTGAIVLGIGLLLGAIIPKLFGTKRRSQMESWH